MANCKRILWLSNGCQYNENCGNICTPSLTEVCTSPGANAGAFEDESLYAGHMAVNSQK